MLLDYITTLGNFDAPYIRSGLYANGYFDLFNVGSDALTNEQSKKLVRDSRISLVDSSLTGGTTYECAYSPGIGFLNSSKPLLPGCEIKLSFDRAKAELALIKIDKSFLVSGAVAWMVDGSGIAVTPMIGSKVLLQ